MLYTAWTALMSIREEIKFYGCANSQVREVSRMHRADDRLKTLEMMIDRIIGKNPHSKEIINAFRPVMVERNRLVETLDLSPGDPGGMDGTRLKSGVPLIKQAALFHSEDPWEGIALSLIPAFKQGFPDLQDDLDTLQGCIKNKTIDLYDYFKGPADDGEKIIEGWSARLNIRVLSFRLFFRTVMWVILHKRARNLAGYLRESEWEKGYCPICGSFPSISMIMEKSGQRWLHCFQCGHEWRFSRVICPYCEHEGQKGMTFFFVEDKKQEAVYTCDQCKRYLLTLNQISPMTEMDLDLSALGLAHLDILMRDKGLIPMALPEWNLS